MQVVGMSSVSHGAWYFIHMIGTVLTLVYVIMPFLVVSAGGALGRKPYGTLGALSTMNRIGQVGLVVQLITGIALIVNDRPSLAWIVVAAILFVALGATTGILGSSIRRWTKGLDSGDAVSAQVARARTMAWVSLLLLLAIAYLMIFRPF